MSNVISTEIIDGVKVTKYAYIPPVEGHVVKSTKKKDIEDSNDDLPDDDTDGFEIIHLPGDEELKEIEGERIL